MNVFHQLPNKGLEGRHVRHRLPLPQQSLPIFLLQPAQGIQKERQIGSIERCKIGEIDGVPTLDSISISPQRRDHLRRERRLVLTVQMLHKNPLFSLLAATRC